MNLSQKEIKALENVVDYVLSYTKEEYEDWVKEKKNKDGHVYYWAELLNKRIWDDNRLESEHEDTPSWKNK